MTCRSSKSNTRLKAEAALVAAVEGGGSDLAPMIERMETRG
jgi:hypothetical protein